MYFTITFLVMESFVKIEIKNLVPLYQYSPYVCLIHFHIFIFI